MRFKDKAYIITLVLFLIFLNLGIFSLAFYTNQKNTVSAQGVCYSEYFVIKNAFEDDITYLGPNGRAQVMAFYGKHYSEKSVNLSFSSSNGEEIYSNMPSGAVMPVAGESSTQRIDGKRLYFITETIASGQYTMTYAKDVSYLDTDFKSISLVFVLTSLGASALLAVILFFVLGKLSYPLERLREAASEIADGDFNARADDSGKDEFSLLASDFNRMADRVSEQMRELEENAKTKQRMLDNLAHEMRTPLTSIRGYAEYLLNANICEDERIEAIQYIISESERLKQIGERLLDDAFIRETEIKPENLNLAPIIVDTAKNMSFAAAKQGVEIKVLAESVYCKCDRLLTQMLISNLVSNAIKACRENGVVTVGNYLENGRAVIFVEDNGVGMTKEQMARITEPFYRTDKSRSREDGGTGLGLALCDRIAKAHNTKLCFESKVGVGSRVTVSFEI
ncbi:MAG: HAMP domain-containing histidine kinase [Clostridia bacterium]|nr:HAMP domain-containing histidine kinase [Clostridia bacterium]